MQTATDARPARKVVHVIDRACANRHQKRRVFHAKAASSFSLFHTYLTAVDRGRATERGKMSLEEHWELQFEHIDWNDIVDAELDGDVEALEDLR